MAFIWNSNPNPPVREMPQAVPPGEVTYQVHVIANSVEPSCTVTYNTANAGFDELCQLPSANISTARFTNAFFNNFTANAANISTATINLANIQTANILNANIMYGYVGSDPTSNLGIASKHYADAAAANVPTGGSDLQNIIDAKGDLLVGTGFHTAARLPVGTNGQILAAASTANTGLRWITTTGVTSFEGVFISTHYTPRLKASQVLFRKGDELLMSDGSVIRGWSNLAADIRVSGAGGLDTGVELPSRWYEVYAIRNGSNGQQSLMLHAASDIVQDASLTTATDGSVVLRTVGGSLTKIAQSFIPGNTGALTSVELELSKVGSPTGLYWATVEADDGSGFPSGTALATARVMDVSRLPTDKARVRLVFDTNTSITQGNTYHIVYQGDYTLSDTNYTTIWGVTAGGYANGKASQYNSLSATWFNVPTPVDLWFKTFIQSAPITAITMPSGYDQVCLVSFVYNDSSSNFKPYFQLNNTMTLGFSPEWKTFTPVTGLVEVMDLRAFCPPTPVSMGFVLKQAGGAGSTICAVGIGGLASTNIPLIEGPVAGIVACNTRISVVQHPGASIGNFGEIIITNQAALIRTQNTNGTLIYANHLRF